jgi:hypothetical protein
VTLDTLRLGRIFWIGAAAILILAALIAVVRRPCRRRCR